MTTTIFIFVLHRKTKIIFFVFPATTENTFDYDAKAPKKETLEHPGVAPGGSSNVSVSNALKGVEFIAQHIKNADKDTEVL